MITFMLVSSIETIRDSAPICRSLSAAIMLPRCSEILFRIVEILVELLFAKRMNSMIAIRK